MFSDVAETPRTAGGTRARAKASYPGRNAFVENIVGRRRGKHCSVRKDLFNEYWQGSLPCIYKVLNPRV